MVIAKRPGLLARMRGVLSYDGREGQISWLLHRLAGLGILLFLYLHIFDIWLMGLGREAFERFLFIYHSPPFKVLIAFLIFGVLYHAVNGLRVILVDFWPGAAKRQRQLVWIETVILLAVLIPTLLKTFSSLFGGHGRVPPVAP